MPYRRLVRSDEFPYHVYARANNREHFYIDLYTFWEKLVEYLIIVSEDFDFRMHAIMLMPNHFHMIVSTPSENLDEGMMYLQREMAKCVNYRSGRMNHLWGGRYKWSLIGSPYHYEQVYRYVYQNPLRAKLASSLDVYPYSSWKDQHSKPLYVSPVPPVFAPARFQRMAPSEFEEWIHSIPSKEANEFIQKGLRRKHFQLNKECELLQ